MGKKETITALVPVLNPTEGASILSTLHSFLNRPLEIVFLYVADSRIIESLQLLGNEELAKEQFQTIKKNAETSLSELAKDNKHQVMVVEGIPFLEIVKVAKDIKVDIIVMNRSNGNKSLENILFGSTTERVTRSTNIPVLCL